MREEVRHRRLAVGAGHSDDPAGDIAVGKLDLGDRSHSGLDQLAPHRRGRPDSGTGDDQISRQDPFHIVSSDLGLDACIAEGLCGGDLLVPIADVARVHAATTGVRKPCGGDAGYPQSEDRHIGSRLEGGRASH